MSMRRTFFASWMFLACAAAADARVVGRTEPAMPLTGERIRQVLPAAEQEPWVEYLRRSQAQMSADRAALAAERQGMERLPPLPPSSPSARSMPLDRDERWYGSPEAFHLARVIISFQTPAGGWGKNMDMAAVERVRGQSYVSNNENRFSAPGDLDQPRDAGWHYVGTLDNDATTTEIRFLARVLLHAPPDLADALRASIVRGVHYLLAAQYPNGGWPQVWPLEGGYHDAVTFNDDAVRNAVQVLEEAARGQGGYSALPVADREAARHAVQAGIGCILRSQVPVGGTLTVWGQQHDELTLEPVGARNFEQASLTSEESAGLIALLQAQPVQSSAIERAEQSGLAWLRAHALYGIAVEGDRDSAEGRHAVARAGAGPLWARFYSLQMGDLKPGTPIFGDRDRTVHDQMNELSRERRNGYAWYTRAPERVLREPKKVR